MKILIVGATRGIGRQVLDQALAAGHAVTALVRDARRLETRHAQLKVVEGDILDAGSVGLAMAGQEAVCCSIGVKSPWPAAVFSAGTRNLLDAMKQHGVRRIVCVTGIGAGDSRGHGGFLYDRLILPLPFRYVYADKDRQEALVRESDAEWVIVRPGFLTNGPLTGRYRALTDLAGVTAGWISRADVAHFVLGQLVAPSHLRQAPLLTA